MVSLSTYILLDVTLPAVLMTVVGVLTFVLTLLGILYKCVWKENDDHPVPLVFLEMVDLAFPDLEKQKTDGYDVFGKGIKSYIFAILTMMIIPVVAATCFITFWNVYAVEEAVGGACVDNFDCFPRMGGEYLQQEPVENCSSFIFTPSDSQQLQNDSNTTSSNATEPLPLEVIITYNCYRLVFRYAEAFGAAGGILAFTALISKLYFSVLVSIRRSTDEDPCDPVRYLWYSLVWSVCIIVVIIFLSVNLGVSIIRETILQTVTGQIQFAMYTITLALIIFIGVMIAIGIEYKDKPKKTCTKCTCCS